MAATLHQTVYSGDFDRRFSVNVTRYGTEQFDDFFLRQMRSWRERLAQDIHHNTPGLSPEEQTYAVQLFLLRIVFLRMCEDREIERYETLRGLAAGSGSFDALLAELRRADTFYDSGLFRLLDDARLGVRITGTARWSLAKAGPGPAARDAAGGAVALVGWRAKHRDGAAA